MSATKIEKELTGHEALTIGEMKWRGKKNGVLLRLMSGQFDIFLTIDKNFQYQQNLEDAKVAFIVLIAVNNKFETLQLLMPQVLEALETIQPGNVVEIRSTQ